MRTDQTHGCASCGVRFAPSSTCPQCGGATVVELVDPDQRALVLEAARRQRDVVATKRREELEKLVRGGWIRGDDTIGKVIGHLVGLYIAYFLILLAISFLFGFDTNGPHLWIVPLVGSVVSHAIVRIRARLLSLPLSARVPLASAPTPRLPAAHVRRHVAGRVRAIRRCVSPIAGAPCAAFRVVGAAGRFALDDAGGGELEVVSSDGSRTRVDLAHAIVDVPVGVPARVVPSAELEELLGARGVRTRGGEVLAAEGVLVDGDEVSVDGIAGTAAVEPEGYRDATYVTWISGTADAPVVIRKLEVNAPRRDVS